MNLSLMPHVDIDTKKILQRLDVQTGGRVQQVIDKSVIDPEDEEMLEDLIMAAINDGYKKADALYDEKMGPFAKAGRGLI